MKRVGNEKVKVRGRVLFVLPWSLRHDGGVNEVVKNLALELPKSGNGSIILNSEYGFDQLQHERTSSGLTEVNLTLRDPGVVAATPKSLVSYFMHLPRTWLTLYRFLRSEDIEVVNIHYTTLSALTVVLGCKYSLRRRRLILSFHGADLMAVKRARGIVWLIWRAILSHADAIVFCSSALAQEFITCFPSLQDRIRVIHNGVDHERNMEEARAGCVPDQLVGKRMILNVATLEWKKGQDVLIQAFAQIAGQLPDHILVLMGRPAEAAVELTRLVRRHRLQDRIVILEDVPHKDVLAIMAQAEVFVLPSRIEPFGIVILEAALFRVPVIASRVGGICEIVEDGIGGVLVQPENVEELAGAITDVLEGTVASNERAKHLYERATKTFTWKRAAAEYLSMMTK